MLHWLSVIAAAVPCLLLSSHLLRVWKDPRAVEDGAWVRLGVGVLTLEFVLVHSGIFAAALVVLPGFWAKVGAFGGMLLVYGLFGLAISAAFESRMLLQMFLTVMAGRFIAMVLLASPAAADLMLKRSTVSIGLYLLLSFSTVFQLYPRLGMTDEAIEGLRPEGTGLWVDKPHLAIGMGCVYFFLLGMAELLLIGPGGLRVVR